MNSIRTSNQLQVDFSTNYNKNWFNFSKFIIGFVVKFACFIHFVFEQMYVENLFMHLNRNFTVLIHRSSVICKISL